MRGEIQFSTLLYVFIRKPGKFETKQADFRDNRMHFNKLNTPVICGQGVIGLRVE